LLEHFFDWDDWALSATRTDSTSLPPCFFRPDVRLPEGPGPALSRPGFVDIAFSSLAVEENAVAVGKLDEALSDSNLTDVPTLEFGYFESNLCGQGFDLGLVHPDVAGRTSAAVAAL
jgi:hypothetical protein